MVSQTQTEVIEITDDAYKQNAVYQPWPEEHAGNALVRISEEHLVTDKVKNTLRALARTQVDIS